jgi:hypothetical protein
MVSDCSFKVFLSGQSLRLLPWAMRATFFHWEIFKIILIFQAFYNDATGPRQGVSAIAPCDGSHFMRKGCHPACTQEEMRLASQNTNRVKKIGKSSFNIDY